MDGGRVAARGFLYQYLRTVEALLLASDDENVYACRIEGDPAPDKLTDADVVDFDLVDDEGQVLQAVQVKSGGYETQLGAGDVFRIFAELVLRVDSRRYLLLTNTALTSNAAALADILTQEHSPADFRAALESVLSKTTTLPQLRAFSAEQIQRLGRCAVSTDRRDRAELVGALRRELRDARRATERGLGQQSAGLLLAYLQAEVHHRAASAEDAVWTLNDFRDALGLPDDELSAALGERDWGGVLGPAAMIPDVKRPQLLTAFAEHLKPYRPAGRTVGKCVLTGLSGIGKSSLVSAYLAEYADGYDAAFWLDASTPAAVIHGFRLMAPRLQLDPTMHPERLRAEIHERLSAFAGRWMMIFDDAGSGSVPWIPSFGDGDVLITTIDSTYAVGGGRRFAIESMLADEAVQLLAARMELPAELEAGEIALLDQLAQEVERWPLAMELAAGYLRSCGYTISDVPHYIKTLKLRSLADEASTPAGYPRTLVTTIDLGVEILVQTQPDIIAGLASDMLAGACYLSGRQIPVHLLAVTSVPEFDDVLELNGPVILDNPEVQEAVRALRRISFVRPDQVLRRLKNDLPTSEHTIAINTVLQEVLGSRIEKRSDSAPFKRRLDRLVFHLEVWLSSATHNGEADKAEALLPHADTLLDHLERLSIASDRIALLLGNVAGTYVGRGELESGARLLETELQYFLVAEESNDFLLNQTRLHLAAALTMAEEPAKGDVSRAISYLEQVFMYAQELALDSEGQKAASTFCSRALDALKRIASTEFDPQCAVRLISVFTELRTRLPARATDVHQSNLELAENLIMQDRMAEAEEICRETIRADLRGSNLNIEAGRLLVEAVIAQEKWPDSRSAIDNLAEHLGVNPLYRTTAEMALYNAGSRLVLRMLGPSGDNARALLGHMLGLPCFRSIRTGAQGEYRAKYDLLRLCHAVARRSAADIESALSLVRAHALDEPTVAEDPMWSLLAQRAIAAGAGLAGL